MPSLAFQTAVLAGCETAISHATLREAQISLCQHAPPVSGGVDELLPLALKWAVLQQQFSFKDENELAVGAALPSYRQMIAHFDRLNKLWLANGNVPAPFNSDCDIVLSVRICSGVQWLLAAVTDGYVSFTCLPSTTKRLDSGTVLLFAA